MSPFVEDIPGELFKQDNNILHCSYEIGIATEHIPCKYLSRFIELYAIIEIEGVMK